MSLISSQKLLAGPTFQCGYPIPNTPCMVHFPTFTVPKNHLNVGKYNIRGSYGHYIKTTYHFWANKKKCCLWIITRIHPRWHLPWNHPKQRLDDNEKWFWRSSFRSTWHFFGCFLDALDIQTPAEKVFVPSKYDQKHFLRRYLDA